MLRKIDSPFSSPNPALANLIRIEYFDENGVSYFVEYQRNGEVEQAPCQVEPVLLPFREVA